MTFINRGSLANGEPTMDVYQLNKVEFDSLPNKPKEIEIYATLKNGEEVFYFVQSKYIKK